MLFSHSECGTKEDFEKNIGTLPLGKFIRSLVGLETGVVQKAFTDFIQENNLTADQMQFIDEIIGYLTVNGSIDKKILTQKPFNLLNEKGILGMFNNAQITEIVTIIDDFNENISA